MKSSKSLPVPVVLSLVLAAGLNAQAPSRTTYSEHVAPILNQQCVSCHRPGGSAPFSLTTFQEAAERADRIVRATASRSMPPWLPDSGYQRFVSERRLSDAEISIIQRWFIDGTQKGSARQATAPAAPSSAWELGQPDLLLSVPRFEVAPHTTDVYRNLVVPVAVESTRYIRAVELRPGGTNVVHHARMMIDTTGSSRALDLQDAQPGFDGMHEVSEAHNPDGFFVGWTPGRVPYRSPENMAWALQPGTDLVLQVHLPASDTPQVVEPQIGLHFAASAPTRHPALVLLGSFDIDIPAGQSQYIVTDRYEVPVGVSVLGLYPHAHYLGKSVESYARLPNGRVAWLLRISDWDFNWQDEYHLAEPVDLPAGSVIHMQITYDNSAENKHNPSSPPVRVRYGSNSTDEMGDLVVQIIPKRNEDLEELQHDLNLFHYSAVITRIARAEWETGREFAAQGDFEQAVAHFRESIANKFDDPGVHNDIGSALARLGQRDAATAHFRQALKLAPGWPAAMTNLARHLALTSEDEASRREALAIAQRAADRTGGTDPVILDVVALAFAANGRMDLAIATAESALEQATAQGRTELAGAIRERLRRYRGN